MQTFSEFFAKKVEENQAPAQQPPKPGAPAPAQQPPKIRQQQKTALLGTVNKAVTGVVDNALKQLKLI